MTIYIFVLKGELSGKIVVVHFFFLSGMIAFGAMTVMETQGKTTFCHSYLSALSPKIYRVKSTVHAKCVKYTQKNN